MCRPMSVTVRPRFAAAVRYRLRTVVVSVTERGPSSVGSTSRMNSSTAAWFAATGSDGLIARPRSVRAPHASRGGPTGWGASAATSTSGAGRRG